MLLLRGKHLLRQSSTVQAVRDLTQQRRVGVPTPRHIQTRLVWLQERVVAKHLLVRQVHADVNPADVLTKALPEARTQEFSSLQGSRTSLVRHRWGGALTTTRGEEQAEGAYVAAGAA
eukprot:5207164-Amphidinium_carterae.1